MADANETLGRTQIGNNWFTWFATRTSKSRLNFLDLLRAEHTDYVLNDAAYGYMRKHALSAPLIASLAAQPETRFADQAAWLAHLDRLGFTTLDVTPDPVRVATEGALWGSVQSHKFLCDAVVLSDDAGQFNVGHHALCWVHAERLVHKPDTFTDCHRAVQTPVRGLRRLTAWLGISPLRGLIWDFYARLKAYRLKPSPRRAVALRKQFDRIFLRRTGFVTLDRLLKRLHANKPELLMGAGPARDAAAHQRIGERHPLLSHPPEGQRRNPRRWRPRLPRCVSGSCQDL